MFYDIVTPFMIGRINEFSIEDILSILISASRPQVTKRAVSRQIFELGIKSIPMLAAKGQNTNQADFRKYLLTFHETLKKFILKKSQAA